jgi:renalase
MARRPTPLSSPSGPRVAVIGAGIAGLTCARTLAQAGCEVTLFEKSRGYGGRMACRQTPFGTHDHGAQYFTVRDERFARVLQLQASLCAPWTTQTVRVMDPLGRVAEATGPRSDTAWVPVPGMNALARAWAEPLARAGRVHLQARVLRIERDTLQGQRWQLQVESQEGSGDGAEGSARVHAGFDRVMLAIPSPQAIDLLRASSLAPGLQQALAQVEVAPCWTLMLAFPQAGSTRLGPQWNAALSSHHRIAWLARESSKPGRAPVERWTVQASAAWSREHLQDDPQRVTSKLLKAFAEITGIRAEPGHTQIQRWLYAKTQAPLGTSHLWDASLGLGLAGDWCLGHRVEDAFVSGLELALDSLN